MSAVSACTSPYGDSNPHRGANMCRRVLQNVHQRPRQKLHVALQRQGLSRSRKLHDRIWMGVPERVSHCFHQLRELDWTEAAPEVLGIKSREEEELSR